MKNRGPETNPEHNAPLIAFLASERAGHVTGQIFGKGRPAPIATRSSISPYPREIAEIVRETPWTPEEVAERFEAAFAGALQDGKITL